MLIPRELYNFLMSLDEETRKKTNDYIEKLLEKENVFLDIINKDENTFTASYGMSLGKFYEKYNDAIKAYGKFIKENKN